MSSTLILTQWYRETYRDFHLYGYWRNALHKYAPDLPILLIDNGGPIRPPYRDVEILPAVEMEPHGRGTPEHYRNCWRSMAYGMEAAMERGYEKVIFLGQNLIVGTEFVAACEENLERWPLLLNSGCLANDTAVHTEYLAASPRFCWLLWKQRPQVRGYYFLELELPQWCRRLGLPVGPFPRLQHERDQPLGPDDTFCFHSTPEEVAAFCWDRGITDQP